MRTRPARCLCEQRHGAEQCQDPHERPDQRRDPCQDLLVGESQHAALSRAVRLRRGRMRTAGAGCAPRLIPRPRNRLQGALQVLDQRGQHPGPQRPRPPPRRAPWARRSAWPPESGGGLEDATARPISIMLIKIGAETMIALQALLAGIEDLLGVHRGFLRWRNWRPATPAEDSSRRPARTAST